MTFEILALEPKVGLPVQAIMSRSKANALFDTNVWGGVVSRISTDEVVALRRLFDELGLQLWIAPSTLVELSFRPAAQRELLAKRIIDLAQARVLRYSSEIAIHEFLMEMLRVDPAGLRGRLVVPPLEIESDIPLQLAMRVLTEPSSVVQEAAEREKLIRMLHQDQYKRKVKLISEEEASAVTTHIDEWYRMPIDELRALVPSSPPKAHKLLREFTDANAEELAEKIDVSVRDGVYYNFMHPVMAGKRGFNSAVTQIIDYYPPARHRAYWERFHLGMDPRRLPGMWLTYAVATLQINPKRFDPKGSDHFDSELATYCKDIDIIVSADKDFTKFLKHPVIKAFLEYQRRELRVVHIAPEPASLIDVIAGVEYLRNRRA